MKICDVPGCENEGQDGFWGEQVTVGFTDRRGQRHSVKVRVGNIGEELLEEQDFDLCVEHQQTVTIQLLREAVETLERVRDTKQREGQEA